MNFKHDLQAYGLSVAWYNVRFQIARSIAKFLIRKPLRLTAKDK